MTIRKLDMRIAEQIAAGEVVENPSSLVKELVENSLDAGAQQIRVSLRQGGLKEITVLDDGAGIPFQEVRLALKRYATSKITCAEDLGKIQTLGFRGEALPSIAAVSKLSITTRHRAEESGVHAYFEGGKEKTFQEIGFAIGTKVTVRDLFFNMPARLKFMKGIPAETAKVYRTIHWLTLSRPDVSFALYREGKLLLETPGDGHLLNVIAKLYGNKLAHELLALDFRKEALTLCGYVSNLSFSQRSRNRQLFFVNQRYVRSSLLKKALDRSYARLVTSQRYPAAFLFLTLPPGEIDVNVHPTKTEVRFQAEEIVQRFLEQSLQTAFTPRPFISATRQTEVSLDHLQGSVREQAVPFSSAVPRGDSFVINKMQEQAPLGESLINKVQKPTLPDKFLDPLLETKPRSFQPQTITKGLFNGIILGQVFATYIVLIEKDSLFFIDQHAAHERILWEEIQLQEKDKDCYQQEIIPFTVEVTSFAAEKFKDKIGLFRELGLEIEPFGHNTFIVRAVPFYLKDLFSAEMCRDIFEELSREEWSGQEFLKETLLQFACKAAIKANHVLAPEEIKTLLERLEKCADPFYCPHGRPVVIRITKTELEKLFKRRG